jgi:hypothetical protein
MIAIMSRFSLFAICRLFQPLPIFHAANLSVDILPPTVINSTSLFELELSCFLNLTLIQHILLKFFHLFESGPSDLSELMVH